MAWTLGDQMMTLMKSHGSWSVISDNKNWLPTQNAWDLLGHHLNYKMKIIIVLCEISWFRHFIIISSFLPFLFSLAIHSSTRPSIHIFFFCIRTYVLLKWSFPLYWNVFWLVWFFWYFNLGNHIFVSTNNLRIYIQL